MAEPDTHAPTWAERIELLNRSAKERVLGAPIPEQVMEEFLGAGKAVLLGRFDGSPVRYLDRWWRLDPVGWVALDRRGSEQLDLQAERYQAAVSATAHHTSEPAAATASAQITALPLLPASGAP